MVNYKNKKDFNNLFKKLKNKSVSFFKKIKINKKVLILSLVGLLISSGTIFGAFKYYEVEEIIKEAVRLQDNENYSEAIKKFNSAQANLLVNKIGLKEEEINSKIQENEKLLQDKQKYEEGTEELINDNLDSSINLLSELSEDSFYYQKAQTKIEEAKRIQTEKELGETKLLKAQAEREAQQEATLKRQKEEELQEKEEEEAKMSADKDGDGLTYREELNKGTSDNNIDSDGDGINDYDDLHPNGGGKFIGQHFEWDYQGDLYEWDYSIHEDWYHYYKNKPRKDHGLEYVTEDDPFIKEIAKDLKEGAEKREYHLSSLIVSFVQGLSYVDDFYTGIDDYPKYPIETFVERNGDCEDTSYLFASLVKATGIGVSLIEFDNHMGVGVNTVHSQPGYYYPVEDDWYYYYETTEGGWSIGELPKDYLYENAKILRASDSEIYYSYPEYVKACYASSDLPGYYYDNNNYFYSDNDCTNLATCISYEEFYVNPRTADFYWDNNCTQEAIKGCYKSDSYPGYFYDDYDNYYYDSYCLRDANVCRASPYYSDRYWDGEDNYWDSNCTQRVVQGCYKSDSYSGKFYESGYAWYYDSECTNYYKSMDCTYPSTYNYSCTSEYDYSLKERECASIGTEATANGLLGSPRGDSLVSVCETELEECRSDIDEYQAKENEYYNCFDRIEY
jgi:hypothetical protein